MAGRSTARSALLGAVGGVVVAVVGIVAKVAWPDDGGALAAAAAATAATLPSATLLGAGCSAGGTVRTQVAAVGTLPVLNATWGRTEQIPGHGLQPKGHAWLGSEGEGPVHGFVLKRGQMAAREVAAYHFDAALGLCRVPPTVAYSFEARDGLEAGTYSVQPFWPGVEILHANRQCDTFGCYRPCKKVTAKRKHHTFSMCVAGPQGGGRVSDCSKVPGGTVDCLNRTALLELSVTAAFDYLTCNADRWRHPAGCKECTVLNNLHVVGDGIGHGEPQLIHLDHNLALPAGECRETELDHLRTFCVFPRALVERLESFQPAGIVEYLRSRWHGTGRLAATVLASARGDEAFAAEPGWAESLEQRLVGVEDRLRRLLEHVDKCAEEHGRSKVLVDYNHTH